jgi:hypothetical protein
MKQLLISLAFVTGTALACPGGEAAKEAAAPASDKSVAVEKAAPKAKHAEAKAEHKLAAKPAAAETRKVAGI